MASIYKIKESELVGGVSNDDLYPVTSTQAVYSQASDGSKPFGVAKLLEDRLQEGEQSLNNLSDKTYRKSETYNRQEIDNRINTVRTGLFVVVDDLPDASEDTLGKIYLVQGTGDTKQEYITVNNGTTEQPDYDWENIGSTSIDLENYSTTEEMEAALDALRDELLEDITDLGNAVYTKEEVYNKAEITEQFNNVAQFRPEWAPYGQLPEPSIATMNRLFLVMKDSPEEGNMVDEYITIRVVEGPYGPLGSMEGEELQSADDVHITYEWERLGDAAIAYSIINIGNQENYIGEGLAGQYTINSSWNLYERLNDVWNAGKVPVLQFGLYYHTAFFAVAMYKDSNDLFSGHEKGDNGGFSVDVRITAVNGIIITAILGTELASNKVTSLSESSTDVQYPSAKCVYDLIAALEERIAELENTNTQEK